jgi:hypothetical protein
MKKRKNLMKVKKKKRVIKKLKIKKKQMIKILIKRLLVLTKIKNQKKLRKRKPQKKT